MSDLIEIEYTFMFVEGVAGRSWIGAVLDMDNVVDYFVIETEGDGPVHEVEYSKERTELNLSGETHTAAVAKIRLKTRTRWQANELAKTNPAFLEVVEGPRRNLYAPDGSLWFSTGPDCETESDPRTMGQIIEDLWAEKPLGEIPDPRDFPELVI